MPSVVQLDLRRTYLSDLTSLTGLTELTKLDLMDTQVSDLTPLTGLVNLKVYVGPPIPGDPRFGPK